MNKQCHEVDYELIGHDMQMAVIELVEGAPAMYRWLNTMFAPRARGDVSGYSASERKLTV